MPMRSFRAMDSGGGSQTPHVGLNLVYLVPGETGGMEVYARELVTAMRALPDAPRLTAFVSREGAAARRRAAGAGGDPPPLRARRPPGRPRGVGQAPAQEPRAAARRARAHAGQAPAARAPARLSDRARGRAARTRDRPRPRQRRPLPQIGRAHV